MCRFDWQTRTCRFDWPRVALGFRVKTPVLFDLAAECLFVFVVVFLPLGIYGVTFIVWLLFWYILHFFVRGQPEHLVSYGRVGKAGRKHILI
jgi:hypothetical protein